jgi:glycosyltransferase involved in cell wall biosynthesis
MKNHLRILMVHNYYQSPGGEDVAFRSEVDLLQRKGHVVIKYEEYNDRIADLNPISVALGTIWSEKSRLRIAGILDSEKPDIVHFQNTFPLISPSVYYACRQAKAGIVQTLQNYRLLCPVATMYRAGNVCTDCLGKNFAMPGIVHACYHKSHMQSAVVAAMVAFHRALGTWKNSVDAYIALTEFSREQFIKGAFPQEKIFIKPNFHASDPGQKSGIGDYALFVGRLSEEKGITTLLSAWRSLSVPLKIVRDGPLRDELLIEIGRANLNSVEYLGSLLHSEVVRLMKQAYVLILPSGWYEGFPLVIAESLACGLPVITSNIGSQAEIIQNGFSGLHFESGRAGDLAEKVRWLWDHPQESEHLGRNARREYEEKYTPKKNYEMLMDIYSRVLEDKGG